MWPTAPSLPPRIPLPSHSLFLVLYEWDGSMGGSMRCCCCRNFRLNCGATLTRRRKGNICVCVAMETYASDLNIKAPSFSQTNVYDIQFQFFHLFRSHWRQHPGSCSQHSECSSHMLSSSPFPLIEGASSLCATRPNSPFLGDTGDGSTTSSEPPTLFLL